MKMYTFVRVRVDREFIINLDNREEEKKPTCICRLTSAREPEFKKKKCLYMYVWMDSAFAYVLLPRARAPSFTACVLRLSASFLPLLVVCAYRVCLCVDQKKK